MSAPTFIDNPEYANIEIPKHCKGVKEQCQSRNTDLDTQVAFMDDYTWKISKMLDRGTPKYINNVP